MGTGYSRGRIELLFKQGPPFAGFRRFRGQHRERFRLLGGSDKARRSHGGNNLGG